MLDFISLSSDKVNIQVSGSTATEALKSILNQIEGENLNGLAILKLESFQVSKKDNFLYNQTRYQWRTITDGFSVNLDPDYIV